MPLSTHCYRFFRSRYSSKPSCHMPYSRINWHQKYHLTLTN